MSSGFGVIVVVVVVVVLIILLQISCTFAYINVCIQGIK
jgi:hypothetical protein